MFKIETYKRAPYMRPFDQLLVGKKKLVGAEVGVYRGQHAREMLEILDIKTLILVDPWKDYKEYVEDKRFNLQVEQAYYDALKLLEQWDMKGQLSWIKQMSEAGSKLVPDNSLDFVYIDGSHQYEYIKIDLECWVPKVKKGGFVGGHDYIKHFTGVRKAVDEYCAKHNIEFQIKNGNCKPYYEIHGNADWAFVKGGVIESWEFESKD